MSLPPRAAACCHVSNSVPAGGFDCTTSLCRPLLPTPPVFNILGKRGAPLQDFPCLPAPSVLQPALYGCSQLAHPMVLSSSHAACRGVTFCYIAGSTCCRVAVDTRSLGRDLLGSSACRAGTGEQRHSTRQAASSAGMPTELIPGCPTTLLLSTARGCCCCCRMQLLQLRGALLAILCQPWAVLQHTAAPGFPFAVAALYAVYVAGAQLPSCCLRLPLLLSHASRCGAAGAPSPHRGTGCSRMPASRVALPKAACRAEPAHHHGSCAPPSGRAVAPSKAGSCHSHTRPQKRDANN